MINSKKVSLIMPVLNEQDSVEYTLDAVFASTRLPDEIIVADAFSTDQTKAKILQYNRFDVPIIFVNNPGIFAGSGRNEAVKVCTGDIVLLLDFGNIVDKHWVKEMVTPFEEDATVDSVAGVFKPYAKSGFEQCAAVIIYYRQMRFNNLSRAEQDKLKPKCAKPGGLGLAIKRRLWDELGGMPSWLRAGEDYIFSRKVCASQLKVYSALDAILYHHIRSSVKQVYKQSYIYTKGASHVGIINRNDLFKVALYSIVFFLLSLSIYLPVSLLVAVLIIFLYVYGFGVLRISNIYSKRPDNSWLFSFVILISRDFGAIFGAISGWVDWKTKKSYKRLFDAYFKHEDMSKTKKCNC